MLIQNADLDQHVVFWCFRGFSILGLFFPFLLISGYLYLRKHVVFSPASCCILVNWGLAKHSLRWFVNLQLLDFAVLIGGIRTLKEVWYLLLQWSFIIFIVVKQRLFWGRIKVAADAFPKLLLMRGADIADKSFVKLYALSGRGGKVFILVHIAAKVKFIYFILCLNCFYLVHDIREVICLLLTLIASRAHPRLVVPHCFWLLVCGNMLPSIPIRLGASILALFQVCLNEKRVSSNFALGRFVFHMELLDLL